MRIAHMRLELRRRIVPPLDASRSIYRHPHPATRRRGCAMSECQLEDSPLVIVVSAAANLLTAINSIARCRRQMPRIIPNRRQTESEYVLGRKRRQRELGIWKDSSECEINGAGDSTRAEQKR
ncbi:hypothetical protein PENSPDRAFT_237536 [Peniophora sp. CONT]|nr:hypothetical protein PENSPDRAFT_237536 [Peniophora sp. CONT]